MAQDFVVKIDDSFGCEMLKDQVLYPILESLVKMLKGFEYLSLIFDKFSR